MLDIYYDYLEYLNKEEKYKEKGININEYKKNLINDYISIIKIKKNLKQKIIFSSLIKIFVLSYYSEKEIQSFLEIIEDLNIYLEVDKNEQIDNKFIELLDNYEKDLYKFLTPIHKLSDNEKNQTKRTQFIEKYKKKLNVFFYIYYILYDLKKIKINDNNAVIFEEILKNLLKKIKDINEFFTFIINKFSLFKDIYEFQKKTYSIRPTFKIEQDFDIDIWNPHLFNLFKEKYTELVKLEKDIFIDFSKIIEKCLKSSKKKLESLKELLTLFRRELDSPRNIKLLQKFRDTIHDYGIELYSANPRKDEQGITTKLISGVLIFIIPSLFSQ